MGSTKIWVLMLVLGVINCFLVGFCQIKAGEKLTLDGEKKLALGLRYNNEPEVLLSFAAGTLTVLSFVKYFVPSPRLFIGKLLLLVAVFLGIMVAVVVFYSISLIAKIIAVHIYEYDYKREHHKAQ